MSRLGGEDRLLAWLRERPGTALLGDDAAEIVHPGPGRALAVTVDSQIAGVHVPEDLDPGVLARRLVQVNLSDLAAVGARPHAAVVALAAPDGFDHRHFLATLLEECAATGLTLAGGDLATSPRLTATLTLVGVPHEGGWVSRAAARPGDELWVGGTLGESAAGLALLGLGARLTAAGERAHVYLPGSLREPRELRRAARRAVRRHLGPRAQLELGGWLAGRERAAAIDLSDGLARDLPRLAKESGVGAEVELASLPVADGFGALAAALGTSAEELALTGGEDYVLLFALPAGAEPPAAHGCRRIGRLTAEPALVVLGNGERRPWPDAGWDHLGGRGAPAGINGRW